MMTLSASFSAAALLQTFGWQMLNTLLLPWLGLAALALVWLGWHKRKRLPVSA